MHTAMHAPQTGLQTQELTKKALAVSHAHYDQICREQLWTREQLWRSNTPMRYKLSSIDSTLEISQGSKRIAATRLNVVIFLILFIILAIAPSQTSPSFLACTAQLAHLLKHVQHAAKHRLWPSSTLLFLAWQDKSKRLILPMAR